MVEQEILKEAAKGKSILYVEDDKMLRSATLGILSNFFHNIDTANNGEKGLDLYESGQYDIVISDIKMPIMDGIEMATRIRKKNAKQLMIIVSAYEDSTYLKDLLNIGVDQFVLKPLSTQQFMDVLLRCCESLNEHQALIEQLGKSKQSLRFMVQGNFQVKTIEDALEVSETLASICPSSEEAVVGISELIINAVEHGNLGITYHEKGNLKYNDLWKEEIARRLRLPEHQEKYVEIYVDQTPDVIRFRIKDQGKGFEFAKYLTIDPERMFESHGRGIVLASRLTFDELNYLGNGNEVEAVIKVTKSHTA